MEAGIKVATLNAAGEEVDAKFVMGRSGGTTTSLTAAVAFMDAIQAGKTEKEAAAAGFAAMEAERGAESQTPATDDAGGTPAPQAEAEQEAAYRRYLIRRRWQEALVNIAGGRARKLDDEELDDCCDALELPHAARLADFAERVGRRA